MSHQDPALDEITDYILALTKADVQDFSNDTSYQPTSAIVITWENMEPAGNISEQATVSPYLAHERLRMINSYLILLFLGCKFSSENASYIFPSYLLRTETLKYIS